MPDISTKGILVEETVSPGQAISNAQAGVVAFVGRTLRGPVDRPVECHNFREFSETFGGLWQSSPLSFSIEQFFINGGKQAVVVRVINGGERATIDVSCGEHTLCFIARSPGAHEALRVSIDYDNILDTEADRFNLVIQRLRDLQSRHVVEQEIYRRLSIRRDSDNYVAQVLMDSNMLRVKGKVPGCRPDRTVSNDALQRISYIDARRDGDDGCETSDYDLIGSAADATGMHALQKIPCFNFLVLPPHGNDRDPGPVALLAAARLCRQRNAVLLIDPPAIWSGATEAIAGFRRLNFASDNAVMFFPRLRAKNRLSGREELFTPSGAVAGRLVSGSDGRATWEEPGSGSSILRGSARLAQIVPHDQGVHLRALGINVLEQNASTVMMSPKINTLAPGLGGSRSLRVRRTITQLVESIREGTRWVVFQPNEESLWEKVREQVESYLGHAHAQGAFPGAQHAESFYVLCGPKTHSEVDLAEGAVNIIIALAPVKPGDFLVYRIRHVMGRSDVSRVTGMELDSLNYLSG